jgi:hypothetical protein
MAGDAVKRRGFVFTNENLPNLQERAAPALGQADLTGPRNRGGYGVMEQRTDNSKPNTFQGDLRKLAGSVAAADGHAQLGAVAMEIYREQMDQGAVPAQRSKASTKDPSTWSRYEDCLAGNGFDGLGFCLLKSGIVAFDVDKCRDPETGELRCRPKNCCNDAATPMPRSRCRGTGIRIIGLGVNELIARSSMTSGMAYRSSRIVAPKPHGTSPSAAACFPVMMGQLLNLDERDRRGLCRVRGAPGR